MRLELPEAITELKELLDANKLNILVGSGISNDSGIPTWEGLILDFLEMAKSLRLTVSKDKKDIQKIVEDATTRFGANRFDPLQVATVIKNRLKDCLELQIDSSPAYDDYHSWVNETFHNKVYNEKHKLIVGTDYPFILTTNYDSLLQSAAYESGFIKFSTRLFTFKKQSEILNAINNEIPCMIHVHGHHKSLDIDQLVFTKDDYNKLILKKYSGFSFALRILFTRYSTLFVGYGASDPHLDEVLEELAEYFPIKGEDFSLPVSYLVSKREKADTILEQYKHRVNTRLIIIDDYEDYLELLGSLHDHKNRKPLA